MTHNHPDIIRNADPSTYIRELGYLRSANDAPSGILPGAIPGTYNTVTQSGKRYTIVPITHEYESDARSACAYGYMGKHAVYLTQAHDLERFIDAIRERQVRTGYCTLQVTTV